MSRARRMINCKLSSSFHSFSNTPIFHFAFPAQFKPLVFCRIGRTIMEAACLTSYYPILIFTHHLKSFCLFLCSDLDKLSIEFETLLSRLIPVSSCSWRNVVTHFHDVIRCPALGTFLQQKFKFDLLLR